MTLADVAGRLLMIGAGTMGGAMLRRWLEVGLSPEAVTVVSPSGRPQPAGVRVTLTVPSETFDTIVLACKPQQLGAVGPTLRDRPHRLLLSILAGVELATLARISDATVVRAMPNLPVAIGEGVVALCGDRSVLGGQQAQALSEPLGLVEWIKDERLFDLVTALAGSGPGFLYRYIDALAEAGAALGLPSDQSARLALATVKGSALLAAQADASPAVLADRVASPGGSTREGLNVLDRDGALIKLLTETLRVAAARNAEMARAAR